MQGRAVDDADFVGAGVGGAEVFAVLGTGDGPRVGGSQIDVVEQDGVEEFFVGQADDAEGVGVHPAAFDLGGGKLVAAKGVGGVGELAVGGKADAAQGGGAVGQGDGGDDLLGGGVDEADVGGDVAAVGAAAGQVVGDGQ